MSKPLRALIVEDSADDAELLLRELRRAGYDPEHKRVETAQAMEAELSTGGWEIVFSDFTMPQFNAFDALALMHRSGLDIPFIIVSGTIGEDRAVTAMKAGAHDYILKGNLKRLPPAVERELREARMRRERREAEETIRRLAYVDPITDLPNRARFREHLQEAVDGARGRHPLAVLLLDLARFKDVNNTLGHDRGDQLLQQVGLRLRSVLFLPDVVARLGGDEFGILLPRLAAAADVRQVVAKIVGILEAPFMVDGVPIAVEACIGVTVLPEHGEDADTLMRRADIAMYRAKRAGHGYSLYAPEHDSYSPERLGLMAELRQAIERDELLLHFQPLVDMGARRIVGTEALVRWQHPRFGLLTPDRFVPAVEHTGLVAPLTRWVLCDALRHCQDANEKGIRLRVSVNLSARSLHDHALPRIVEEALAETGVEPGRLTAEITESAIVLSPHMAGQTLTALSAMGVRLSIDDFGTGYTSLASLGRLPIDEVKIDRSFVSRMLTDKNDAMIVRSVIELGHNLGLNVVAEGIESREVFDALAAIGCDTAQGFFIARPQLCRTLTEWFAESPWPVGGPG